MTLLPRATPRCSSAGARPAAPCSLAASERYCVLPKRSVDVDAHRPVAKSFGVRNVPFVTLLRHGAWFTWDAAAGEPVPTPATRFEGALAADAVAAWLNNRRVSSARCSLCR